MIQPPSSMVLSARVIALVDSPLSCIVKGSALCRRGMSKDGDAVSMLESLDFSRGNPHARMNISSAGGGSAQRSFDALIEENDADGRFSAAC
jgi:hypothetical protein